MWKLVTFTHLCVSIYTHIFFRHPHFSHNTIKIRAKHRPTTFLSLFNVCKKKTFYQNVLKLISKSNSYCNLWVCKPVTVQMAQKKAKTREKNLSNSVQCHNKWLPQNKWSQISTKQVKRALNSSWKTSKAHQGQEEWIRWFLPTFRNSCHVHPHLTCSFKNFLLFPKIMLQDYLGSVIKQ